MKIAIVGFAAILAVGIGDAHAGSAARETLRALTQEKPGSPYHWVADSVNGGTAMERVLDGKPGPTIVDDTLKRDVMASIAEAEKASGASSGSTSLVEVRQLPKDGATYREVWVVDRNRQRIAYTVFLTASADGGVDFELKGPCD